MGQGQSVSQSRRLLQRLYRDLDEDGSGYIERREVSEWIRDELFVGNKQIVDFDEHSTINEGVEAATEKYMNLFDADHDGKISKMEVESFLNNSSKRNQLSEIGSGLVALNTEVRDRLIRDVFEVLDKNDDGSLSKDEVIEWLAHEKQWTLKHPETRPSGLGDRVDSKEYNRLERKTFERTFDELDQSQDGLVDFEEFKRYTKHWTIRQLRRRTTDAFYFDAITKRSQAVETGLGFDDVVVECMVCCCAVPPGEHYLRCGLNGFHNQCIGCFAQYVQVSCDSYLENTIPLCCPVPQCKHPILDRTIHRLLMKYKGGFDLWNLYLDTSLRVGLMSDRNLCVITCQACDKYSELYPRDYEELLQDLVRSRNQIISPDGHAVSRPARLAPIASDSCDLMEAKGEREGKRTLAEEARLSQAEQDAQAELMMTNKTVQEDRALHTEFFTCKLPTCSQITCLLCWQRFPNAAAKVGHNCGMDDIKRMYDKMVEVLASAASRRCPKCGEGGRKDLACTHMSCQCGTRWCYHCGKTMGPKHNDFRIQNLVENKNNRCPMYLRWGYSGTNYNYGSGKFEGDAGESLDLYHIALQREAVHKYTKTLTRDQVPKFKEMLRIKFPDGIWDHKQVEKLDYILYNARRIANNDIKTPPKLATPRLVYGPKNGKHTITVRWEVPICEPRVSHYTVGFRKKGDAKFQNVGTLVKDCVYVCGLNANEKIETDTDYQFNISGYNIFGWGPWTYTQWIHTGAVATTPAPVMFYEEEHNRFTVKWTRPISLPAVTHFTLGWRCVTDNDKKFTNLNGARTLTATTYQIGHYNTEIPVKGKLYQCNLSCYNGVAWSKWRCSKPVRAGDV